jgi:hypothetical protein
MEGWRQGWRLGGRKTLSNEKTKRTHLTPTGLLMEGDYTQNTPDGSMSVMAILRQLSVYGPPNISAFIDLRISPT